jgi:hypothetical protein
VRNTAATTAELAFLRTPEAAPLTYEYGHSFTSTPEIWAETGIAFLPDETVQAAAGWLRRGGGSVTRSGHLAFDHHLMNLPDGIPHAIFHIG